MMKKRENIVTAINQQHQQTDFTRRTEEDSEKIQRLRLPIRKLVMSKGLRNMINLKLKQVLVQY